MYSQCDTLKVLRMNREQCYPIIMHNQWREGLPGCKSLKSFDDVSFGGGMGSEDLFRFRILLFLELLLLFLSLQSSSGKSTAVKQLSNKAQVSSVLMALHSSVSVRLRWEMLSVELQGALPSGFCSAGKDGKEHLLM